MNEHDLVRLNHMRQYAQEVVEFIAGENRASLDTNLLVLRAVCMSLGIVGEAAANVSEETRSANPQIPWGEIIRMRTFVIHIYHRIDADIVWNTAVDSVPKLIEQLNQLLSTDE